MCNPKLRNVLGLIVNKLDVKKITKLNLLLIVDNVLVVQQSGVIMGRILDHLSQGDLHAVLQDDHVLRVRVSATNALHTAVLLRQGGDILRIKKLFAIMLKTRFLVFIQKSLSLTYLSPMATSLRSIKPSLE